MQSVLVIDDSEMDRDLSGIIIAQYDPDIRVSYASDGEDALARLGSEQPDVILLDINMPVLDGFGFLNRYETLAQSQVYVMIACEEQQGDIRRASRYSCVAGHVFKPLSLDSLAAMRRNVCGALWA